VAYYYTDNSGDDGDGSIGDPWNNVMGHVDELGAGDTMYIRGNESLPVRIYTEACIDLAGCNDGTASLPIAVQAYPGEYVEIASTVGTHGININNVDYWVFRGLYMDASNVTYMIDLNGDHNIIEYCILYDGYWAIRVNGVSYNMIEGCTIHNFLDTSGPPYSDAHGVYLMGGSHYTTVRDNTIYDIRGDCVQLSTGTLSNNLIEDNHLYTTLGKCSENAIDLKGGSPVIRGNVMHGFRYCDGSCGATGGGIGAAITSSAEVDGAIIEDNEIYDCTSGMRVGLNTIIRRNVIHDLVTDAATWLNAAIMFWGADNARCYNNTFVECPETLYYISASSQNVEFRNNLAYKTHDIEVAAGGTYDADYNGWFDCMDTLAGAHDTTGDDPLFVDPENDDYHLQADSPCIDAGVEL